MVSRFAIERNLDDLDTLFTNASSTKKKILYSKLAIIELCGWIEMSFDEIAKINLNRLIKNGPNRTLGRKFIKQNYGFHYHENVRLMFLRIVGFKTIEKVERELEKTAKITVLSSLLQNLKDPRNNAAHTYTKGSMLVYNAPSVTKATFSQLYPIIVEYDKQLRKCW